MSYDLGNKLVHKTCSTFNAWFIKKSEIPKDLSQQQDPSRGNLEPAASLCAAVGFRPLTLPRNLTRLVGMECKKS